MKRFLAGWLSAATLLGAWLVSGSAQAAPLQIRFLDVDSASYGSFVGIYGAGFGTDKGTVEFGSATSIELPLWSDRLIIARIPAGASTGKVRVKTASQDEVVSADALQVHTGSIYVVSSNGSDAGSGDENDPFQSLHRALSVAQAGDTVLIRAGSYDEQDSEPTPQPALYFRSDRSGTTSKPITWRGYGAEVPVIRGTRPNAKDSPIVFVGADYVRLARLDISGGNNTADALSIQGNGVWAVGLQVHEFGEAGITVGEGSGVMLAGNTVHGGGSRPNLDHGIILTGSLGTVRDNEIRDLPNGYGIFLQYPTQGATNVFANYIHDVAGGGIGLSRVKGGNRVYDNVIWKAGASQGCKCGIQAAYGSVAGETSTGDRIYYNTVVGPTFAGAVLADRTGDVELHGNVFAQVRVGISVEDDVSQAALQSSHNLWSGLDEAPQFKWGGPWMGFAAFQAASQQEGSSSVADPLLVDIEQGDFHLTPASPAVDVGGGPDQPQADFDGVTRPQGAAHDLGAFEYDGTTPPVDGGTGGDGGAAGAAGSGGGGTGGGGGSAGAGGTKPQDAGAEGGDGAAAAEDDGGGCGCAIPAGRSSGWSLGVLAAAFAALGWRVSRRLRVPTKR